MTIAVDVVDGDGAAAEATWRGLEAHARGSYFLSWGWIENWLACLPRDHRPELALLSQDGEPIAACFVVRRRVLRHHLLPTRTLFLNATGVPRFDELVIEHNGLLRAAPITLRALVDGLTSGWDELSLPGVDASELAGLAGTRVRIRIDREVPAPFVELARVRASRDGYVGLLGPSTRAQLRRARRGTGELVVEHAADLAHARAIYDELVALHTESWRARGQPGAFADPWFDGFHRRLIAERFASGEIELVRVSAGGRTLGCLYNFVHRGRVLFYQSGLAREDDPRIKPGFLCHAAAIEDAARAGHAVYDFLGGDARYKHGLATHESRLVWARVQRPLARFALEEKLRAWRHA